MLWWCADCTTGYAVGLAACPHCGSTRKEDEMPKITRHEGPSFAPVEPEPVDVPEKTEAEAPEAPVEKAERPAEAPAQAKPTSRTPAKKPPSRTTRGTR